MSDIETMIVELQNEAADCELMGSLAADPEVRAECRRKAEALHEKARKLRDTNATEPPHDEAPIPTLWRSTTPAGNKAPVHKGE